MIPFFNHKQQISLQDEANKMNSREIDIISLTTKGHCITIRHAARAQTTQDKPQG